MGGEEVIELSIEETNKLRAELGLAPLRITKSESRSADVPVVSGQPSADESKTLPKADDEVLELSVSETNDLRAKLGLAPLRTKSARKEAVVVDLKKKQSEEELAKELETKKLKEAVSEGIASSFVQDSLSKPDSALNDGDIMDWASRMRKSEKSTKVSDSKKSKKKKMSNYDETALQGMKVSHAMSEFEAGSTTVLTLADSSIIPEDEENDHATTALLENVNLSEQQIQQDGLRKKRQLEMGMGRAGGYAGFDDDEFAELGGTLAPSREARGNAALTHETKNTKTKARASVGFHIGEANGIEKQEGDLFAFENGRSISLEPSRADVEVSDFMTAEEAAALEEAANQKKKKKKDKFKKKSKKKKKESRKRRAEEDSEGDDDNMKVEPSIGKSFLDELEATAEPTVPTSRRKRNHEDGDSDHEDHDQKVVATESAATPKIKQENASSSDDDNKILNSKRSKYDDIMAKGNARTQKIFQQQSSSNVVQDNPVDDYDDAEPDDAFLNVALAKARRLARLRKMSSTNNKPVKQETDAAIAEAVQSNQKEELMNSNNTSKDHGMVGSTGITFEIDDTREFTRALRARTEQKERQNVNKPKKSLAANVISTKKAPPTEDVEMKNANSTTLEASSGTTVKVEEVDNDEEMVELAELAKKMKDDEEEFDDDVGLDGTTGSTKGVGRGLSSVVDLLKQTGDLTRKNAGKEELRGRAKDERNYEDYQPLNLQEVVKIGENATDRDKEFARRQVKLEYRDKHGRLLTRKEAFRDLCYQFHGHGSSKRKEEKRMQQVAREQAEARLASQQLSADGKGAGTFGALRATQKATGRAFVVHRT